MYNRDNKIMRKLLGRIAADNATDTSTGPTGITSAPHLPTSLRPSIPQDASYKAGVPVLCFDCSPDRSSAVLAGRHVLKTVKVEGNTITDSFDLRGFITSNHQPSRSGTAATLSDQLSIKDVKWHGDTTIFTACSNGKIFSYDLARLGGIGGGPVEFVQTREDSRQVNSLDINPHRGSFLLSGSQDGLVRCFDIRTPHTTWNGVLTWRALQSFKCNAEGVRHVKWSPTEGLVFACATEAGVIFKWDYRNNSRPLLRIPAHDKSCASISWHPDGAHLMSGGWDMQCHVWDMTRNADKRQKPKWTISVPAPVASLAWRPGLWSASAQGRRVAQVAVCYVEGTQRRHGANPIHIWDLARPSVPFKEIQKFDVSPAALMWRDQDTLWTGSQDGQFAQYDVTFAPRVVNRIPLSSTAISSRGEVMMFLDERHDDHLPSPRLTATEPAEAHIQRSSFDSSPSTPVLAVSRSDSDEDVVGSFHGARRRMVSRKRDSGSRRSTPGTSTTPPSAPGFLEGPTIPLDDTMRATGIYQPQQAMAFGQIPATAKANTYHYLSRSYLEIIQRDLPSRPGARPFADRLGRIMEKCAKAAENASLYRLAQSWRILAYTVNILLERRAQYHVELRAPPRLSVSSSQHQNQPSRPSRLSNTLTASQERLGASSATRDETTPRAGPPRIDVRRVASIQEMQPEPDLALSMRSILSEEAESTSNVPTPLARPVTSVDSGDGFVPGRPLTPVLESESFTLPPAIHSFMAEQSPRRRLDSVPLSVDSEESTVSQIPSMDGYDFYDTDALARAIEKPSRANEPPPNMRQDSAESFGQMSALSSSTDESTSHGRPSSDGLSRVLETQTDSIPVEEEQPTSQGTEADYESRIRGQTLLQDGSPVRNEHSGLNGQRTQTTMPDSPEDMFLISQTTMASDSTLESYKEESIHMNHAPPAAGRDQQATLLERLAEPLSSDPPRTPIKVNTSSPAPAAPAQQPDTPGLTLTQDTPKSDGPPAIVESDYFLWPNDPTYPFPTPTPSPLPPPINPYTVISRTLSFETRSSALTASAIVLLLQPLLPYSVIDPYRALAILRQHHQRLMGMQFFVEAALLRNLSLRGWPEGLPFWGENYRNLYEHAQENVGVTFACSSCKTPFEMEGLDKKNGGAWVCERCKSRMGPCAVCGHHDAMLSDPDLPYYPPPISKPRRGRTALTTWWYCPGCGHGGHSACLEAWHAPLPPTPHQRRRRPRRRTTNPPIPNVPSTEFSDGCCPLQGCGHACLPGKYRSQTTTSRANEIGRATLPISDRARRRGSVGSTLAGSSAGANGGDSGSSTPVGRIRGDDVDVEPSRAVESVRSQLGGSSGGGILGSSPREGERERRKSVKFVGMT